MAKGGFRGMPGGMNQAAMMKQAQKMQQEMLRMQEEMENKTYSATTGGGMVMRENNRPVWNAQLVNTEDAYTAWGLSISDLEKRLKKLRALERKEA